MFVNSPSEHYISYQITTNSATENSTGLCFYVFGAQKSSINFIGPKSQCRQSRATSIGSRGESFSLPFLVSGAAGDFRNCERFMYSVISINLDV